MFYIVFLFAFGKCGKEPPFSEIDKVNLPLFTIYGDSLVQGYLANTRLGHLDGLKHNILRAIKRVLLEPLQFEAELEKISYPDHAVIMTGRNWGMRKVFLQEFGGGTLRDWMWDYRTANGLGITQIDRFGVPYNAAVVWFFLGGNDYCRSVHVATFQLKVTETFQKIRVQNPDAKIIVGMLPPIHQITKFHYIRQMNPSAQFINIFKGLSQQSIISTRLSALDSIDLAFQRYRLKVCPAAFRSDAVSRLIKFNEILALESRKVDALVWSGAQNLTIDEEMLAIDGFHFSALGHKVYSKVLKSGLRANGFVGLSLNQLVNSAD